MPIDKARGNTIKGKSGGPFSAQQVQEGPFAIRMPCWATDPHRNGKQHHGAPVGGVGAKRVLVKQLLPECKIHHG